MTTILGVVLLVCKQEIKETGLIIYIVHLWIMAVDLQTSPIEIESVVPREEKEVVSKNKGKVKFSNGDEFNPTMATTPPQPTFMAPVKREERNDLETDVYYVSPIHSNQFNCIYDR